MKREIAELIEATRSLRIETCSQPENPKAIRLLGNKSDFPERLYRLQIALEAVDRAGAQTTEGDNNPTMDAACLRTAIDNLFKWMRSTGIDITEPYSVVANALGAPQKAQAAFKPAPKFNHAAFKQGSKTKNPFRLVPAPGEKISLDELRKKSYKIDNIQTSLGSAAVK